MRTRLVEEGSVSGRLGGIYHSVVDGTWFLCSLRGSRILELELPWCDFTGACAAFHSQPTRLGIGEFGQGTVCSGRS